MSPHADTLTDEEREAEAARGRARMQRLTDLMRKHTKAELLHMAYAGGLVNHNSPVAQGRDRLRRRGQRAPGRRPSSADRPPTSAASPKRPPVRHHHDECNTVLYKGGACDLIEQYGPPFERDGY